MRTLVTGCSGFLGRHLCRVLRERGDHVYALNSKNYDLWPNDVEVIFHLAAWTQAGDFCLTHSGEQFLVNQKINMIALENWKTNSPNAKFIAIGTSCAYAPGPDLREAEYMTGAPHASLSAYAMTKRMLYEGCRALNKQYGMRYLYLVPSTLYGPDYHVDGRQSHFIFDLIRKIIRGKELDERVVLWGDGKQTREIIYVEDFVRLMLEIDNIADVQNDIFNLGANESYYIKTFAHKISRIVGYDTSNIIYDTNRYVGAFEKTLNVQKAVKVLGHYDTTQLEDGLKKTIDWFYATEAWR